MMIRMTITNRLGEVENERWNWPPGRCGSRDEGTVSSMLSGICRVASNGIRSRTGLHRIDALLGSRTPIPTARRPSTRIIVCGGSAASRSAAGVSPKRLFARKRDQQRSKRSSTSCRFRPRNLYLEFSGLLLAAVDDGILLADGRDMTVSGRMAKLASVAVMLT